MVMQFKTCCCGCSLKTGTVIISVLGIVGGILALIVYTFSAFLASGQFFDEVIRQTDDEDKRKILSELQKNNFQSTGHLVSYIIMAILAALHLVFSSLLLYGTNAERPSFIKAWIINDIFTVIAFGIIILIYAITDFNASHIISGVYTLVLFAAGIPLEVYLLLVVNSFYNELVSMIMPLKA